jgi:hypothetical protein
MNALRVELHCYWICVTSSKTKYKANSIGARNSSMTPDEALPSAQGTHYTTFIVHAMPYIPPELTDKIIDCLNVDLDI